ncbi:HAD family hydrolase [Trinickia acidisoli]|uniref:HAD family hydrolase n=1 Tax=Trinickia acidisoli TaxID=2767482 RepID=UPI001A8FFEE5|nr:HAD family hydrolase [Trinickia acidisoli]
MKTFDAKRLMDIEHIVFDWNGTLLDDIELAVKSVNLCARRFDVASVTRERYREAFHFPIASFYATLGFDLERTPFAEIVQRYLEHFDANVAQCPLHDGVTALLDAAADAGVGVSVLSASHRDTLTKVLDAKALLPRFAHVVGLTHNLATSKTAEAALLQKRLGGEAARTLFVGDTTHDCEVAHSVGWTPLLVSTGHQTAARLLSSGATVLNGLGELLPTLSGERAAIACRKEGLQ